MDLNGCWEFDNIEDVCGQFDGGFIGWGGGFNIFGGILFGGFFFCMIIIFVVIYFVVKFFFGVDFLQIFFGLFGGQVGLNYSQLQLSDVNSVEVQVMKKFVLQVLVDIEDIWMGIFEFMGKIYEWLKFVMYLGEWCLVCGEVNVVVGLFYCFFDYKVYFDMDFFCEMQQKFKVGGDFVDVYVIVYEVGYYVQNLFGILLKFNQVCVKMSEI